MLSVRMKDFPWVLCNVLLTSKSTGSGDPSAVIFMIPKCMLGLTYVVLDRVPTLGSWLLSLGFL